MAVLKQIILVLGIFLLPRDQVGTAVINATARPQPGQDWYSNYGCDFDTDFCDFTQDKSDDFDWGRASARLPHSDTGPQFGDHTSTNGFYAFINASWPRKEGQVARIVTPTLRFSSHCAALSFWYYALGLNLGSLTVRTGFPTVTDYGNWSIVFQHSGPDITKAWRHYQTVIATDATFRLAFEGVAGNGYQGDYAIDDISVKSVPCPKELNLDLGEVPRPGWAFIFNTSDDSPPRSSTVPTTRSETVPVPLKTTTRAPASSNDFPPWAIALLVIGCFFVVSACLFLFIRYIRKQRKQSSSQKYVARSTSSAGTFRRGPTIELGGGDSSTVSTSDGGRSVSDNSAELPTKNEHTISVPIETRETSAKSVRFQADYETEYGFGLRLGGLPPLSATSVPSTLAPVPKELTKEAAKIDKKDAKQRRPRSKLTVRQRRRLRLAAKLAAQMKAQQGNNNSGPTTFSVLHSDEKFPSEPGKKKPIPLPPPHILNMLMKMRTPNNPLNRANFEARRVSEGGDPVGKNNPNSVVAIIEPNVPRRASNQDDLGVEDVSDDDYDFGDENDDEGSADAEDGGSDASDDISAYDLQQWEQAQLALMSGDNSFINSSQENSNNNRQGGIIVAPNVQRNQVIVIKHAEPNPARENSPPPKPPPPPSNKQLPESITAQTSKLPANIKISSAPGLYDGLDGDDDD